MDYIKDWLYGWISEDDSLWGEYWYLYSANINVTWNSKYIELYNKPILSATTTSVNNLLEVKDTATNQTYIFAFCANWKVYKAGNNIAVYDNNSIDFSSFPSFVLNWVSWWVISKYVYFISAWTPAKLNRITLADAISWAWGSPTLWYKDLASTSNIRNYWVITRQNKAIIWLWSKINVLTNTASTDDITTFDLTWWEEIVWITYISWYYRIYTDSWKIALWDWTSDLIGESFPLQIKTEQVYQIADKEYIIAWYAWWRKALYIMSWYNPVLMFKSKESKQLWFIKFGISKWNCTSLTNDLDKIFVIEEDRKSVV